MLKASAPTGIGVETYPNGTQVWTYLYTTCDGGGTGGGGGGNGNPAGNGFPSNPYDGMVYTYFFPDGASIEYTYNESLGLWLLPEVQILSDLGYDIEMPPDAPVFNAEVLTVIATPALSEPTYVGELVLGGAAIVVSLVYVYDSFEYINAQMDYDRDVQRDRQYCIDKYVLCVQNNNTQWGYNDCSICLQNCIAQGGSGQVICVHDQIH